MGWHPRDAGATAIFQFANRGRHATGDGAPFNDQQFRIVREQKPVYTFQSKGTQVDTLVHSGWDALPPGEQNIADSFDGGWTSLLAGLKEQMEKQ